MREPIRVLQVCQRMEAAGVQSFIMNIYRNIDRNKIQFDFLVHYQEQQFYEEEIQKLGGHVYKLSVREDYNLYKYWHDLKEFFHTHHYDIVHGHMDSLGAFYLGAAKQAGVPIRIAHAHTDFVDNGIKKIPRYIMISLYRRNANYLFACSNKAGEFMFKHNKFMVYRNAIQVERFVYNKGIRENVRNTLNIDNKFVIGNVGRFHIVKNQLFLLDVMRDLISVCDNAFLMLIGNGELEENIKDKINELHLNDYVMILKNRNDINDLYQAMDVFALPSLFEGIPLVGIEAQTSGLPCVFSDRINHEVSITNHNIFLPIDHGIDKWVASLTEIKKNNTSRENVMNLLKDAGYDSVDSAKKLENFYLSSIGSF